MLSDEPTPPMETTADPVPLRAGDTRSAIKVSVERRYAAIARSGPAGSCCAPARDIVAVGTSAQPSGASPRPGVESAAPSLAARELDLGCGNPLPFAEIREGETVLDLGCGSGAEVLRAARMVGPEGRAFGVDMTEAMLDLARANRAAAGVTNAEFLKGDIEDLPLPEESVDVIVSNCVLNLSPDKAAALEEAFRVLRPGGRFVVADVVVPGDREPEPAWRGDLEGWSGCANGAMTEGAYRQGLESAGFADVRLERIATYDSGGCCGGSAEQPVASDLISARKPQRPVGRKPGRAAAVPGPSDGVAAGR